MRTLLKGNGFKGFLSRIIIACLFFILLFLSRILHIQVGSMDTNRAISILKEDTDINKTAASIQKWLFPSESSE